MVQMAFCDLLHKFHKQFTNVSQHVFVILLWGILTSPLIFSPGLETFQKIICPHRSFLQPPEEFTDLMQQSISHRAEDLYDCIREIEAGIKDCATILTSKKVDLHILITLL